MYQCISRHCPIGLRYDVPMSAIKAQLSTFSGQRQNIIHVNDYILIDDAYNASPDSMKASLRFYLNLRHVEERSLSYLTC